MSYDTVKNGIKNLIKLEALAESDTLDFKTASPNEFGFTYILKPITGEMDKDSSETLADRFYDIQSWEIQIAYAKNQHSDAVTLDNIHRKKDDLLKRLDNPSNWSSFVRMLKYDSWEVAEEESYFLLVIKLEVIDTITY